jgi:hypothetical protein
LININFGQNCSFRKQLKPNRQSSMPLKFIHGIRNLFRTNSVPHQLLLRRQ